MLLPWMLEVEVSPVSADPVAAGRDRCSLSIVIPAYNEASRLAPTILRIHEHLIGLGEAFEIIVVSDGSSDETLSVAHGLKAQCPQLRVLGYPTNRGKGFAVRIGVLQAAGALVLFSDADLSTPIEELPSLLGAIRGGAHIAIASRHLARSRIEVQQPLSRRYLGRIFNFVISLLGVLGFADTQCVFKLFRAA